MNYAKAKQLAQKMFGPTARLERGKTKEDTWTWAILIQKNGEWVVAGNGGTFDQMLQNAAKRAADAHKKFAKERPAMPAADAAAEALPKSGTNEAPK